MTAPIILADNTDIPDPLERYISRLLRRDIFNAASTHDFTIPDSCNLVMFGSAVVQKHRPLPGYPVRRMARDLDLGVVIDSRSDLTSDAKEEIGKNILAIVKEAGAEVMDGTLGGVEGYDGFRVEKTYSQQEIIDRLKGRLEEGQVEVKGDMTAELDVSEIIIRSPLLPPVPFGETGFMHEDIREVAATKMARIVTPEKFAVRDIIDIYNMMKSDPAVLDLVYGEQDLRELTRLMVVASITRWGEPKAQTRENLEANEQNVDKISTLLGISLPVTVNILTLVQDALEAVFPKDLEREDDLPKHVRGELNLSRRELDYMMNIEGVEVLPGAGNARRIVRPNNNPSKLKPDYPSIVEAHHKNPSGRENDAPQVVETDHKGEKSPKPYAKFPDVFKAMAEHHEINDRVKTARARQLTQEF